MKRNVSNAKSARLRTVLSTSLTVFSTLNYHFVGGRLIPIPCSVFSDCFIKFPEKAPSFNIYSETSSNANSIIFPVDDKFLTKLSMMSVPYPKRSIFGINLLIFRVVSLHRTSTCFNSSGFISRMLSIRVFLASLIFCFRSIYFCISSLVVYFSTLEKNV